MNASRRGFLASLLALPVVAKLLPAKTAKSPFPITIKPIVLPSDIDMSHWRKANEYYQGTQWLDRIEDMDNCYIDGGVLRFGPHAGPSWVRFKPEAF